MSFSADYHFVASAPKQGALYYWVIVPGRGDPVATQVDLRSGEGTLQGLVTSIRPDQAPFECHIVEVLSGQRRQVSRSYPLP